MNLKHKITRAVPFDTMALDIGVVHKHTTGPAWLLTRELEVLDSNLDGAPLDYLFGSGARVSVRDAAAHCEKSGAPVKVELEADAQEAGQKKFFDVLLVPGSARGGKEFVILGLGEETSHTKNMVDALLKSRELFRDFAFFSRDLLWEVDKKGRFVFVSEKGGFGYATHELAGMEVSRLAADAGPTVAKALTSIFCVQEEGKAPVETWIKGADGQQVCIEVVAQPVRDSQGRLAGARGIARDITELHMLRLEVLKMQERLALAIAGK